MPLPNFPAGDRDIFPYELVDELPRREALLEELQWILEQNDNPIAFPKTSIFNDSWEEWQ